MGWTGQVEIYPVYGSISGIAVQSHHCCFLSAIGECRQGEESGLGSLHAEATDNPQRYDAYDDRLAIGTLPPECFCGDKMKTVAAPQKGVQF